MNMKRIVLGGVAGGVGIFVLQGIIHAYVLAQRYQILQEHRHLRVDPRFSFLPVNLVVDLVVGIGLTWVYAVARGPLGRGPRTALLVGLVVGLLAGVPTFAANFAWTYTGGYVNLWWAIDTIAGFTLATFIGGWLYKD
jgi:hypothetical protein